MDNNQQDFLKITLFTIKNQTIAKICCQICYVCSEILSKNIKHKFLIFKGFLQFLNDFTIFLKPVYIAEIPSNRDRILFI